MVWWAPIWDWHRRRDLCVFDSLKSDVVECWVFNVVYCGGVLLGWGAALNDSWWIVSQVDFLVFLRWSKRRHTIDWVHEGSWGEFLVTNYLKGIVTAIYLYIYIILVLTSLKNNLKKTFNNSSYFIYSKLTKYLETNNNNRDILFIYLGISTSNHILKHISWNLYIFIHFSKQRNYLKYILMSHN